MKRREAAALMFYLGAVLGSGALAGVYAATSNAWTLGCAVVLGLLSFFWLVMLIARIAGER